MKISVLLSPLNADELYFTDKTTVVIDVLRATTSIVAALDNGAKEVIPVNSIEFAMKASGSSFGGNTLLAGERNSVKIDGFSLGNSPLEFTEEAVKGKSLVLYTTNGSKAIVKAKFSENLLVCSFNNLPSVAEYLSGLGKDVIVLCAGSHGMFCLEDTVCAGLLVQEIKKRTSEVELTDSAKAGIVLYESFGGSLYEILAGSEHGKELVEKGFAEDIAFCAETGNIDVIPHFINGSIKTLVKTQAEKENEKQ